MTDNRSYKPPLNIYLVWYPTFDDKGKDNSEGHNIAAQIYSYFSRDIDNPMSHGLWIPMYFRSGAPTLDAETTPPPAIDLELAQRNVIIVLVDGSMVLAEKWREY